MSAEGRLQRSGWKAEAIRRGELKISGPILIAEKTPLTDTEESEQAEKMQVSSQTEKVVADPPSSTPPPAPVSTEDEAPRSAVDDTDIPPTANVHEPHNLRHKTSAHSLREKSETQAGDPLPAVAYTSTAPIPPIQRSSTSADPKKKRKGSFRNVFRKMFGRRARDSGGEATASLRHSHHRSEPITLLKSPQMTREEISGSQVQDLPVRELEPINPLAQHLPFPMNVNAPQEASPPHAYINFDVQRSVLNRRRATLPTVLQAASDGQLDDARSEDQAQSPQIGIALSSPPPPVVHTAQSKRRSRSAGALRNLAMSKARPSIERRRSAEIRYWRGSYQPESTYSAATPRPQTSGTVETARMDIRDPAAVVSVIIADLESDEHPVAAQVMQDVAQTTSEVDSFDFGDLASDLENAKSVNTDVPTRKEKRLSIEERVKHLEDNMQALETTVRRISGRTNRQTIILENAPPGRRSRGRDPTATSDWHGSHHSSPNNQKVSSKQRQHSRSTSMSPATHQPEKEPPTETQHLTPDQHKTNLDLNLDLASILPSSTEQQNPDFTHQLSLITSALQTERSSRQVLEAHVDRLQREVTTLHAIVAKLVSRSPAYPTPSPDTIVTACAIENERLSTPRAATHSARGFGPRTNDAEAEAEAEAEDEKTPASSTIRIRETVISRFSQSDSEPESYNSVASSREDITSPETWATPKEEGFGSGFFEGSRSREIF